MPFHSPGFLLLLLPTFALYYVWRTQRWQHFLLFVSSFAFYYFAGIRDLCILLFTTFANYLLARLWPTKRGMIAGVALNLGVLAYFKYRFFLADLVPGASQMMRLGGQLSIPFGISFYIFQLIAYQVDRWRGLVPAEENFSKLLLYILFFPHHQAGPIMRPAQFLPQFVGPKQPELHGIATGVRWILWGLAKKVAADRLGLVLDPIFAAGPHGAANAWAGAIGYYAQIYGDFSGYSDMAVGLGLLFGYRLDRNFNQPYLALNPSDFWNRWHITLSSWLRDYLYIPLGGNKHGPGRTYLNLMLTMLLGGLWHGAAWNFVVWGAIHGALLCAYRVAPRVTKVPVALRWLVFQVAVLFAWIPFRCVTLDRTLGFWQALLTPTNAAADLKSWLAILFGAGLLIGLHLLEDLATGSEQKKERAEALWLRVPSFARGGVGAVVLVVSALMLVEGTTFIYFRF